MMENNNNNDNKSFSFVSVATEGMDMKQEREKMLQRKGKTSSSLNVQKQEKDNDTESTDINQKKTQTSISHTENLTPSLVQEEEIKDNPLSNEGGKIEKENKGKKVKLNFSEKETLVYVKFKLSSQELNILNLYLSSLGTKTTLPSFVCSLIKSKIKSIRKELTDQSINALLGLESKE